MRGKILESFFDEASGTSWVTKHTKYGTFTRYSYCHEEDKDIMNEWDGCRFAEAKCDLAALKEKNKMMHQRLIGMDQILDILEKDENAIKIHYDLYNQVLDLRNSVEGQINVDTERYQKIVKNYQDYTDKVLKDRRKIRAEK